jgi:soluble lytic murein transglycosylase-like protein
MRLHLPLSWRACARNDAASQTDAWRQTDRHPPSTDGDEADQRTRLIRSGTIAIAVASLGLLVAAGAAGFRGGGSNIHVVQPGDTLWAISRADGLTVAQLAAANNMNPNDLLLIGRRLIIPAPGSPSSASQAPTSQASASQASASQASASRSSATPASASQSKAAGANPWTFCSTFVPETGPWGVLPALLRESPQRLALRPLFRHWANYYGLSAPLLEAIAWQESGWQQDVVSSAGAVGTGQILPSTASFVSSTLVGKPLNIKSQSDNIRMSAALLSYLADIEGNNRCQTIAAYYEGAINLSHYGVFPESQAYVASVEALIPEFE